MSSSSSARKSRLAGLIITGIAINFALGATVTFLRLPIFLDQIGTVTAAIVAGYWASMAVAVLSLALHGVTDSIVAPAFVGTAVIIAVFASFAARRGWLRLDKKKPLRGIWRPALVGLALSPFTASSAAPVAVVLFHGIVPNAGYSAIFLAFKSWLHLSDLAAGFATSMVVEPFDKIPQVVVAVLLVYSIPKSVLANFPAAVRNLRLNEPDNDGDNGDK